MYIEQREAMHYSEIRRGLLKCDLCPHFCVIHSGEAGKCRGRENIDNKLIASNYGKSIGLSLDRIEKKPLYHFRPGSEILSLGPNSCNLSCRFCQNYSISQYESPTKEISIEDLYKIIEAQDGHRQLAFTYTEPLTWYEYIYDFAAKYRDVDVVLISNGYVNPNPLAELLPMIKAVNIDLKSSRDSFYTQECGGSLEPVKSSIEQIWQAGVHLEITMLLIPGLNDSPAEIEDVCSFLSQFSKDIPLHISAYHPDYLMDVQPTLPDDIFRAVAIAKKSLNFVYGGNVPLDELTQSSCPDCGKVLVERGYGLSVTHLAEFNRCPICGKQIYGIYA